MMAQPNPNTEVNEAVDAVDQSCTSRTASGGAEGFATNATGVSPVSVMSTVKPYHPMTLPPTKRDDRKLFVGGLPPDVTDDEFRTYFEQFGEIFEAVVMYDRITGRSRGFGFVTFHDTAVTAQLIGSRRFQMRDKTIEVKAAQPKITTGATTNNALLSKNYQYLLHHNGIYNNTNNYSPYFVPHQQPPIYYEEMPYCNAPLPPNMMPYAPQEQYSPMIYYPSAQ